MPRYQDYPRDVWAARRTMVPPRLATHDGGSGGVGVSDLAEVYCPLAELIGKRAGEAPRGVPFIVSVVGSVAVGKSTSASALRALLAVTPPGHRVDVVATDGFLFSNRELAERGLTERKGFPETYDLEVLTRFLEDVRGAHAEVRVRRYSHLLYDVVDDVQIVDRPDVLILEGMPLANDRVDLSVYLDAAEPDIEEWFVSRFVALCRAAVDDDTSFFFRHFAGYTEEQSTALARDVWVTINSVNLREHILPTRDQCDVILEKGHDHAVKLVRIREDAASTS